MMKDAKEAPHQNSTTNDENFENFTICITNSPRLKAAAMQKFLWQIYPFPENFDGEN